MDPLEEKKQEEEDEETTENDESVRTSVITEPEAQIQNRENLIVGEEKNEGGIGFQVYT